MRVARRAPGWRGRTKTGESRREEVGYAGVVIPEARPELQMVCTREDIARVFWAAIDAAEAKNHAMQRLEDALRKSDEARERYKARLRGWAG